MIQPLLRLALEPVAVRHRQFRLFISLAVAWAALATIGLGLWWVGKAGVLLPVLLACIGGVAYWILRKRADAWEPDWHSIARKVEEGHPDLHALLITAVEQRPDPKTGEFHFLQHRVIQSAVDESRRRPWLNAVPDTKLWGAAALQLLLFAAFLSVLVKIEGGAWRTLLREKKSAKGLVAGDVNINPGDTEVERGSGLVVLATFNGNVPGSATLVFQPLNGPEQRLPLTRNLEDPVFGGALSEVDTDLTYRVEHSGRSTRTFKVRVFEHPRLERADAQLHFPDYTKLPEKQIADTRRVSAVEGSKLDLSLALNKPVKSAKLVGKNGTVLPLKVDSGKPVARLESFDLRASDTYTLQLQDEQGLNSKVPAQFIFEALPNRRPELKLALPRGDQRVSPLQEVAFQEEAWDDFGLLSYGLSYTVAGGETKELVLGKDVAADQKVQGTHLLKLEELKAEPDQLVSWYAWAEDIGPDGKPRRTASDMFFAEVRPFEEIYRQGQDGDEQQQQQQQGQGQGGAGGAATKLAETQKQIITATWNLRRSEEANASSALSEKYRKDEPVIRDSQKEVLKQAEKLREKAEQPRSQALAENVIRHMQAAAEHLDKAAEATAALPDALQSEQAAYNALLKLAAHEFQVTKRRSSSQGGGEQSGGRQQQLDQLELKEERQRYETKREAAPQQNQEQREQLGILNRLKELAQRQQDINERLKELQTALEEAKTEQQKEEVRRQLKRLREEEQQLVADMDEARQKMDTSANASQFSQERRQMEQTRSEAQQASEAMERQDASRALASGSRTQRDLQQMRDEFRNKTSGQFREEMRDLRSDARQLAENQQKLSEQLNEAEKESATPTRRSLDGSSPREQLGQQFSQQQEQLKNVQERMQQLSEQAEAAEPLLARELYDSLRKTAQAGTQDTLDRAGQLARRGFTPQARQFEEKARQEIEDLKSGVERAAESVLGNEAEALKLAQSELDALSRQLEKELAQADPQGGSARRGQQSGQQAEGQPQGRQGGKPSAENKEGQQTASGQNQGNEGQQGQTAQDQSGQRNGQGNRQGGQPNDRQRQTAQGNQPGQGQQGQPSQPGQQQGQGNQEDSQSQTPEGQGQLAANSNAQPGNQQGQQRGGQQPGSQQGRGQQPGDAQRGGEQANNQQAGNQQPGGQQSGSQQGNGQQSRGQQPGSQTASAGGGNTNGGTSKPGQPEQANQPGARLRELASTGPRERGGIREGGGDGGGDQGGGAEFTEGPIRGEGFVQWSDRLRNVEEMLDDPKLRADVARVREVARGVRTEAKRHSKDPKWDVVRSQIKEPLAELRNRVTEELARRESKESLVPIDRDPVPTQFVEHVRRYYEELGRSR